MYRLFFTLLISSFVWMPHLFAQDKIVRSSGKEVDCYITAFDSASIHFAYSTYNGYIRTFLNRDEIEYFIYMGEKYNASESPAIEKKVSQPIAVAQPVVEAEPIKRVNMYPEYDKRSSLNAINMGLIGPRYGSFGINYERLVKQRHGWMIGTTFQTFLEPYTNVLQVGYRYHYHNTMSSGFIGVNLRHEKYKGHYDTYSDSEGRGKDYYYSNGIYFGPDIGWRWILARSGINFVFRFGYGIPVSHDFTWADDVVIDEYFGDKWERDMVKYMNGIDFELSIGFSF